MKLQYHYQLPKFDHRLPPVLAAGAITGDRSAARSAGTRPGRAGHQRPIREFSIGTFRKNSSGTDKGAAAPGRGPFTTAGKTAEQFVSELNQVDDAGEPA